MNITISYTYSLKIERMEITTSYLPLFLRTTNRPITLI